MESTVNQASLGDDSGIGSRLRRAREDSGRSIQEIADELPLRPKILEALENDDFENLPAPIFVRGYLRTYARLLDISPDPLLEAYERYRFPPPKLETSTPLSQSIQPSETLFRTLTHVGLAGLVVLVLLWWQYRSPDGFDLSLGDSGSAETIDSETQSGNDIPDDFASSLSESPSETPSASNDIEQGLDLQAEGTGDDIEGLALQEPAETETASAAAEPIPEIAAAEPDGSETALTSEDDEAIEEQDEAAASGEDAEEIPAATATAASAGDSDSADASSPQGEASQPSPTTPEGLSRITIRLRHESWIEVYDRKGERLMFELADADREISLVGDSPFDVLLGNAKDVEVEYNGTPFDYGPHTLNGIARFRLED